MSILKPFFPKDAIKYHHSDKKILVINPETRRWTVTNQDGLDILEKFDGVHSIRQTADILKIPGACFNDFHKTTFRLLKEQILVKNITEYECQAQSPCQSSYPQSLHLEITNQCNLKCKHCYVSAGKVHRHELTFREIKRTINDFVSLLPKGTTGRIGITGGEARLRSDCLSVLEYCRNSNLDTVLFTNGIGLTEAFIKKLKNLEVAIQISLDGPDAHTNDSVRGIGTFDKIMQSIDLLLAHGMGSRIILFVTLTKQSIRRSLNLLEFAKQKHIGYIHFSQLNAQGRASSCWNEMAPTSEQWIKFGDKFLTESTGQVYVKGNEFGGLFFNDGLFPRMRCKIFSAPRIDCRGYVYACQLFVGDKWRIGNIRKESLDKILKSDVVIQLSNHCSQRSLLIEKCRQCLWNKLCHSGCPGHAAAEFGTLDHEDSSCSVRLYWFEKKAHEIILNSTGDSN